MADASPVPPPSPERKPTTSTTHSTTSSAAPKPSAPSATVPEPADERDAPSSPPSTGLVAPGEPAPESSTAPEPSKADEPSKPSSKPADEPSDEPSDEPAEKSADRSQPLTADDESQGGPTRSEEPVPAGLARKVETVRPETLEAPAADVETALKAGAVEAKPEPASTQEVDELAEVVKTANLRRSDQDRPFEGGSPFDRDDRDVREARRDRDGGLDWNERRVKQWNPEWVAYDDYYRPVISNPYRQPVKIIYVYDNRPRIVYINPLQRIVLDVARYAAYSFTAVVVNTVNTAVNTAVNLAVGTFFGGGYFPGYGVPLPPPPPPLLRYDNVPVQVRYSDAVYEPFRVQRIVDVGDDVVYGGRKVLLDGVTPAWGQWTQSPSGERQFEIHKTQQFPGLDEPREGPLPGDYRLQLASDEAPATDPKTIYMVVTAAILAIMSLAAVGWSVALGRRRTQV